MLGEVVAVALKRGLDPKSFLDIMTSTMFGGRVHRLYGDQDCRAILCGGIRPAFGPQGHPIGARGS
jgi:hypothetical protein